MTGSVYRPVLDNFGIRIRLSEIPEFQHRRYLRDKLFGNWLRRLWWMHVARVIAPPWRKQRMQEREIAERLAIQKLVDATLEAGFMAGHGGGL